MTQQQLVLQKMEEVVSLFKALCEERDRALERVKTLDHENRDLKELITFAETKVDEVLDHTSVTTITRVQARRSDATSGILTV